MPDPESLAASRLARTIYRDAPARTRLQQAFRPYICSFEPLVVEIRSGGGRLLDFGCGGGLFTFHCVDRGYIDAAEGVDVNPTIVGIANEIRARVPGDIRFHAGEIPPGAYDTITMIDVMHHLSPAAQKATFFDLAERLAENGTLVYKDIGHRPRWRAAANRIHDLVLNRQWIHYVPIEEVIGWAISDLGMKLHRREQFNQFVYGHELAVFRRGPERVRSPAE